MAYTSGDNILDDHYNGFVSDMNTVIGPASGNNGWGQSTLSTVSAGSTITATQWNTLLNQMEAAGSHTSTAGVSYTTIATGNSIAALADISTDITNITTNRGNLHAHGSNITGSKNHTGSWNTQLTFTATTTFASDADAHEFFNAGGQIGISFSTANASGAKDTGWANVCAAVGTIWLSSAGPAGPATTVTLAGTSYQGCDKKGGSGTATTETNKGFHDLTASLQELFKQYDSTSLYTANYIAIQYKYTANAVTISVICRDDANTTADPGATQDETVTVDINCTMTTRQPSTTYITNSWGTPTVSVTSSAS